MCDRKIMLGKGCQEESARTSMLRRGCSDGDVGNKVLAGKANGPGKRVLGGF